ncbi:MAG: hypothetical protein H7330_00670 [Hymenobacteraceae bacterium]|nr:hypothetical protein [Hymenobacteraceae bacterium]
MVRLLLPFSVFPAASRRGALLLLAAGVLLTTGATAQKIEEKDLWTTYHKSAMMPLQKYKTFAVEYDFDGASPSTTGAVPVIPGLQLTREANPDLVLKIFARAVDLSGRTRSSVTRDKIARLYYVVTCKGELGYELVEKATNTTLMTRTLRPYSVASKDFVSEGALEEYMEGAFPKEQLRNIIQRVKARVAYELGAQDYRVRVKPSTIETKAAALAELAQTGPALEAAIGETPHPEQLQPLIGMWSKHLAQVNWEDKKADVNKKVANALIKNLCAAYLIQENYAGMHEMAKLYADHNKGIFDIQPQFEVDNEEYLGATTSYHTSLSGGKMRNIMIVNYALLSDDLALK